jgi:ABC-type bacteriocin/lantibiotic exporter with double-glycine peptidase domain
VRLAAWGALVLGVLGFGCISYRGSAQDVTPSAVRADPGWRRIEHLPPVHQKGARDCGAAALSSVLEFWRQPAPPPALERDQIDAALRKKPDEGLTAGALRDYARKQGFHAYVFSGQVDDLTHEVEAGRPVIVGVHKALSTKEFLSHYEVVLGFHRQQQLVLTFDPAHGLRENRLSGFLEEWQRAGRTTLVVMP